MRRIFIFIAVLSVLLSLRTTSFNFYHTSFRSVKLAGIFPFDFSESIRDGSNLRYNFYKDSCPEAENIVRSAVTDIYFNHRDLHLLFFVSFHDCFIQVPFSLIFCCFSCILLFNHKDYLQSKIMNFNWL